MLSIQMDLKSEKEKIHQMHHDIRLNALIDLPLRKGQNLSINSYYEKVCLFKSIHHRNAWPYKIILMVLKFVIDGRTKVFNNAMHQVLNHGREKITTKKWTLVQIRVRQFFLNMNGEKWKKPNSLTDTTNV